MKTFPVIMLAVALSLGLFGCSSSATSTPSSNSSASSSSSDSELSYEERLKIAEERMKQTADAAEAWDVRVTKAWYQPSARSSDIIVDIQNDTDVAIKDIQVNIAAWDSNNLPVLLRFTNSGSISSYVFTGTMDGINIPAGASTAGRDLGFTLAQQTGDVPIVKAIVASYTDFNGNTVENPNGAGWRGFYNDGRPL